MKKDKNKSFLKIFYYITVFLILFIAAGFLFIIQAAFNLPDVEELSYRRISQSTKIYDKTGEVILYEVHGEENRTVVPFDEIPEVVKQATIAAEDRNFYRHPAFDWQAIIRAFFIDITQNRRTGGSTITQQLAKNAFLSPEQTISRKVKELLLALRLERRYTKDEILELYLNQIPYGGNAYGIEAASRLYFGKPALELNLAEAAILAALPQAPSYYSPYGSRQDELFIRRDYVLNQMESIGYINFEEREEVQKTEISFKSPTRTIKAPHFTMMVMDYLRERYGEEMIETGGLRVITTIDLDLQEAAEKAVTEGAERNFNLYQGRNAALVAQEVETGAILALVGSYDYFDIENEGNFNVAALGLRQPGSAFKPFVYASAFEKGFLPETVVFDVPTEFSPNCPMVVDFNNTDRNCYHPRNFDNTFRGPVTLRQALAQSLNVPAVKVLYLAGLDKALEMADRFGISTLKDKDRFGLSLVLGGGEIKLTELVNAYAVFARDGKFKEQYFVEKVTDSQGRVLEENKNMSGTEVIDPQYVRLVNNVLTDIDARSGLFSGSLRLTTFDGYEIALKTGTTNDYVDAWTFGYTPNVVAGVWAGNNRRQPMQQQAGSLLAALPIWNQFFAEVVKKYPAEEFIKPEPSFPDKPILRGDLSQDLIHSILYFVDKNNPLGPIPKDPSRDGQFWHWETPVLAWVNEYGDSISRFIPEENQNYVRITIENPESGQFISGKETLLARVTVTEEIDKIQFYINNKLIEEKREKFSNHFVYRFDVLEDLLDLQNSLRVRVITKNGNTGEASVVVYK